MKRILQLLIILLILFAVLMVGTVFLDGVYKDSDARAWAKLTFNERVWIGETPLSIPPLAEIVGGATTDAEAVALVAAYYDTNTSLLAAEFREQDDTRLRGLFGMYIIHLAAPYNVVEVVPTTLFEFINTPTAHCGTYSVAQSQVYDALGLEWRIVMVDGGWHGLIEVLVNERWETFDSTVNVWLSVGVPDLIAGTTRSYRAFYTPIYDANADDVYRQHYFESNGYYNVSALREGLPFWGISVFPARWEITAQSS